MNAPIRTVLCALSVLWVVSGCAMSEGMDSSPTDAGGPQDPPTPVSESIIPLQPGYCWYYQDTYYDTGGARQFSREELTLAIPHAWGVDDTGLVLIDEYSYVNQLADTFPEYYYEYEWDNAGSGWLITYRDESQGTPGVYVVGWYDVDTMARYDSLVLWLQYPAVAGETWQYAFDTSATSTMTLLSSDTMCVLPDVNITGMSPVRVLDHCWLYRQNDPGGTSYLMYHEDYGCVAYQRYVGGALRRTYVVSDWELGDWFRYYQ